MKNYQGLSQEEVIKSREQHGKNLLTPPKQKKWWQLYLEKFKDPIIIILLVALGVSFVVGFIEGSLIESIGILVAIILATGVGFWMEYSAKKKFDILNQISDTENVKVIRNNGTTMEIPKDELVVGDIVILSAGDEIPADIELLEAIEFKVDESTMTGESVAVGKRAKINEEETWNDSGFAPFLVLRSTKITEGSGVGVVIKVGDETEIGKTTRQAMEETGGETPLNKQLDGLAGLVSKAAFTMAGLLLLFLNIHHFGFTDFDSGWLNILGTEVKFFMMAVTLIVVAVPEGLPLASTLSLAFSMKTMARENNLVKKMHACETIGAVNVIFSDKTGTLTQNKMKVVEESIKSYSKVAINGAINSTANINQDNGKVIGNPTEGAILGWINNINDPINKYNYDDIRNEISVVEQVPFNSTNKYMSTKASDGILYVKGAPEVVSRLCGDDSYLEEVSKQQSRGRRAISFASGQDIEHLEYDGSVFIEDPIRPDVPAAIKKCYEAGVDVVMMTGDNIKTAAEIARQAGFSRKLQGQPEKDVWAVEAKDFDKVAWGDPMCGYPNVIARCKPEDKLNILKKFKELGKGTATEHVCAMTGDGVNDSPSLNHADVGIAMGSGTSVAKEASDIVLLDDAFPSIVTGIKWGRSLYKNIQSFLVFQLIINVATCLVVVLSPILGVDMPFTVTQMLWVNIVMDTLAALCLASEPADENVLTEKPRKQNAFILTKPMYKTIIGMGIFVFGVLSLIVHDIAQGSIKFGLDLTELFAIFMMINWWNLFNIRVFGKNRSIFYNLKGSSKFLLGSLVIFIGTILIVQFGGEIFNTRPLDFKEWCIIVASTSPIVIIREIWHRIFPKK
jgi:Ca2+-transporting ATPase